MLGTRLLVRLQPWGLLGPGSGVHLQKVTLTGSSGKGKKKKKGQLTNLRIFVVICLSVRLRDVIQELKQRRFLSGAHQPEVVFFAFFGSGFAQILCKLSL